MAIPKFLVDLAIMSKLGDYPGSDDGMSTEQFKAKFDEAGLLIQEYLNDILIPELDKIVDVDALLADILDSTLTKSGKAAPANIVGENLRQTNNAVKNAQTSADGKCSKTSFTVLLRASGWSGNRQTVYAAGVLADTAKCDVLTSPMYESREAYNDSEVSCISQGDNTLTFACEGTPVSDLTVGVLVLI